MRTMPCPALPPPSLPLAKYYKPTNEALGWAIEVDHKLQQLHDVALKVTMKVQCKGQMARFGEFQNMSLKCLTWSMDTYLVLSYSHRLLMYVALFGRLPTPKSISAVDLARIWKCVIHLANVVSNVRNRRSNAMRNIKSNESSKGRSQRSLCNCVNIYG